MGWFSTPKTPAAPPEGVAPNRSQRARCWDARDAFFECLDRNAIVDPVKHAAAATDKCPKQETAFERECVASWVEYFKKRRVMEHNRSETFRRLEAEGAKAVGMPNPVGQAQAEQRREAEQRP